MITDKNGGSSLALIRRWYQQTQTTGTGQSISAKQLDQELRDIPVVSLGQLAAEIPSLTITNIPLALTS